MTKHLCCVLLALSVARLAAADDFEKQKLDNWHQFRGPLATGVAPHGDPPTEWSETKNIKWKVEIPGRGSASPIVWGNRIYLLTAIESEGQADASDAASNLPDDPVTAEESRERRLPITLAVSKGDALLAQREDANSPPADADRGDSDGRRPDDERRGVGEGFRRDGFRRGGFGRGFGRQQPTKTHKFVVLCIDRKTGKTIWTKTAHEAVPHEGHHQTGSFASASPITDGRSLFASFGSQGIYCYDLDGNPKWSKDLGDMTIRMGFGEGSSPAVHGDTVVVPWDHEEGSFIVALDANTGDEKWRKTRDESSTWATPLIVNDGKRIQVITSGSNRVRSYDINNGEVLWECGGLGSNPIACPVVFDGLAIAMSGHRDPAGVAVPLSATGDVTESDQVAWRIEESTPYVSSPLLYDDTLYFVKSRNAIVSSVAARTGQAIIDQKRLPDMDSLYASPVGAADRVYFCSREGMTVVLKHGPTLEILASNPLDEVIDASPAIVGDAIYIRGEKHLYCISKP